MPLVGPAVVLSGSLLGDDQQPGGGLSSTGLPARAVDCACFTDLESYAMTLTDWVTRSATYAG